MSYEELQKMLVNRLRAIGIYHSYKDRLELAWYKHHVAKVTDDTVEIRSLIDKLIVLRREGQEPAHKDGRYV